MSCIVTYNIPLAMDNSDLRYWTSLLEQARDCFNACANAVAEKNLPLSLKVVHERCYHTLRAQFPLLPSQAVIKMQQEVLMAFKAIRSNKHKEAETPQRKSLSMRIDKRLYSNLNNEGVSLSGPQRNKRQRYEFHCYDKVNELFRNCTTKDPLIFIRDGKAYLSVPFEVPVKPVTSDTSIGVDLGERMLFVTSEGKAFRDKTYLREKRKVRHLKKKLQSKNTKSSKKHLKKVRKREKNVTKDMANRACNALIKSTDASILVLENLKGIKKNTSRDKDGKKKKDHNRRLGQVPFYLFKEVLTNKAPRFGKKVETVSAYNTSQMDSRNGCVGGNRVGRRYYGKDGVVLDADWNAAVNIAKRGKHPFSTYVPLDGAVTVLSGRVLSTTRSCRT